MVRFYEFVDVDEDLEAALDAKAKQLDNQAKAIANRKAMLKNRKAQQANRETVQRLAKSQTKPQ